MKSVVSSEAPSSISGASVTLTTVLALSQQASPFTHYVKETSHSFEGNELKKANHRFYAREGAKKIKIQEQAKSKSCLHCTSPADSDTHPLKASSFVQELFGEDSIAREFFPAFPTDLSNAKIECTTREEVFVSNKGSA